MEYKVFNDSVHGHMELHPLLVVIADTRQMQRLRNIKQLGACYFVYPSATHSRFEHSIGTAFIAGKLFDSLKKKREHSIVEDDILWEKRKLCAQVAGLCHDLGHGPFSHMWETFRKRLGDKWTHEEESLKIFDEVLKESISPSKKFSGHQLNVVGDAFTFYGLKKDDIELIKTMIRGQKKPKSFLFQIISNKTNNIDVDKWEYITRDSFMLNIPVGFDFKRLLNYCCVVTNKHGQEEICFREKECPVLLEMFLARGKLHDVAYQHKTVKIVEEMLLDAFLLANERLELRETSLTSLSDHIFQRILFEDFGGDEKVKKAKEILHRIEIRHLYKCIAQESYEGKCPEFRVIKQFLSNINGMTHYIDEISMTTIKVHMTKSNKEKALKNVLVYHKEGQKIVSKPLEWEKYQDCLKPNLEKLKRNQVLLLYKGKEEFPRDLIDVLAKQLKMILVDIAIA